MKNLCTHVPGVYSRAIIHVSVKQSYPLGLVLPFTRPYVYVAALYGRRCAIIFELERCKILKSVCIRDRVHESCRLCCFVDIYIEISFNPIVKIIFDCSNVARQTITTHLFENNDLYLFGIVVL